MSELRKAESTQQSVPKVHRDNALNPGNPGIEQPGQRTPWQVVRVGAFSSRLRGLKLVPLKWRYPVPPMLRDG